MMEVTNILILEIKLQQERINAMINKVIKFIKFIKTILRIIYKLFIYLFALLGFMMVVFHNVDTSHIESCIDDGGVWDDDYEECRFECKSWSKDTGCVIFTDKELDNYVNGYCSGDGKGLYRCKQALLELSRRKLRDRTLVKNAKK